MKLRTVLAAAFGCLATLVTGTVQADEAGRSVAKVGTTEYPTLQAAIDAAARNATVQLIADTKENVTIAKALTLDLNGFTLNGGTERGKPALTVTARIVTVKDSSAAQSGTIKREDTAENSGVSSHYVIDIQGNGWLTFEGGNVVNDSGDDKGRGASLVRVGDDSVAKFPGLNIKGGTFTQDNFVVIKVDRGDLFLNGGTLTSANSYAIENWLRTTIKGGTVNGAVSTWTYGGGNNSNLTVTGGTINGDVISVNYGNAEDKTAKVAISGGTVNGGLDTRSYVGGELTSIDDSAKATIEVTGGSFTEDPSKYVTENSSVTRDGNGTFGVAKAYLAKVGETSYYTMDEAFKAQTASGDAIVLLRDHTTGSTFNSGSIDRTVDLNGHTWTYTGTDMNDAAFEINHPNVTLTVTNGKVSSDSMLGLIPSATGMGGIITYDNAGLVFKGVVATVNGRSGIESNGNNADDSVTLNNSTLKVPNGFGVYFPSSGTVTIENSVIEAKTMGVQVCSGSLSITDGSTITVTGDGVAKTGNDGAIEDGAAVSVVNRPGYKGLGEVAISGGAFKAKAGNAAFKAYTWENLSESAFDNAAGAIAVSGGTFSSSIDAGFCADGFIPTKNEDGTYGVKEGSYVAAIGEAKYASLAEAMGAAADGETVTLLADVTEDVEIAKSITLDLNGKTLTNANAGKATVSVSGGAVATVKNGSVIGGASYYTIEVTKNSAASLTLEGVTATAGNTGSSMIDNWGTLTINSGTYTGGLNVVKSEEGSTLAITGGTFTLNYAPNGYTGVVLTYGDTTISGGEFIQGVKTHGRWAHPTVVLAGVVEGYPSTVKVTGGSFTNSSSSNSIFHGLGKATSDNFEVSGGTFNKSISDGYCADGFIPTKNADGTYGVVISVSSLTPVDGSRIVETEGDADNVIKSGVGLTAAVDAALVTDAARASYRKLFELSKKQTEDGKWLVSCVMTAAADAALKAQVDDPAMLQAVVTAVVNGERATLKGATPGLYYSVVFGTEPTKIDQEVARYLATSDGTVAMPIPKPDDAADGTKVSTKGFYRLRVSVGPKAE